MARRVARYVCSVSMKVCPEATVSIKKFSCSPEEEQQERQRRRKGGGGGGKVMSDQPNKVVYKRA